MKDLITLNDNQLEKVTGGKDDTQVYCVYKNDVRDGRYSNCPKHGFSFLSRTCANCPDLDDEK